MSLALLLAAPWKMAPFASLALGSLEILTINYECQIKSVYKTNFRTPVLVTLKNLMRYLTAQLEDGYCSITVANYRLITVIRPSPTLHVGWYP